MLLERFRQISHNRGLSARRKHAARQVEEFADRYDFWRAMVDARGESAVALPASGAGVVAINIEWSGPIRGDVSEAPVIQHRMIEASEVVATEVLVDTYEGTRFGPIGRQPMASSVSLKLVLASVESPILMVEFLTAPSSRHSEVFRKALRAAHEWDALVLAMGRLAVQVPGVEQKLVAIERALKRGTITERDATFARQQLFNGGSGDMPSVSGAANQPRPVEV